MAGITRAMTATVKFGANRDTMLLTTNIPSTNNIAFLRFTPENNNGVVGAHIETVRAKRLTSNPALDTLI
ncbi:hypothetical protein bcgnr5406_53940 [Bacillus cereus]